MKLISILSALFVSLSLIGCSPSTSSNEKPPKQKYTHVQLVCIFDNELHDYSDEITESFVDRWGTSMILKDGTEIEYSSGVPCKKTITYEWK